MLSMRLLGEDYSVRVRFSLCVAHTLIVFGFCSAVWPPSPSLLQGSTIDVHAQPKVVKWIPVGTLLLVELNVLGFHSCTVSETTLVA